jgi:hypothetical protein
MMNHFKLQSHNPIIILCWIISNCNKQDKIQQQYNLAITLKGNTKCKKFKLFA